MLQVVIGSSISVALRNILLFLGGAVLLVITNPKLTGIVFLFVPFVVAPIVVIGRVVRRRSRSRTGGGGQRLRGETLGGDPNSTSLTHENSDRAAFGATVDAALSAALDRVRARAALTALVILLVFSAVGLILWLGGHDVVAGRMSAGDLSAHILFDTCRWLSRGGLGSHRRPTARGGCGERLFELLATNRSSPRRLSRGEYLNRRVVGGILQRHLRYPAQDAYPR